eukprot:scaffold625_cov324-Pavlova_lutheri.AAC.142
MASKSTASATAEFRFRHRDGPRCLAIQPLSIQTVRCSAAPFTRASLTALVKGRDPTGPGIGPDPRVSHG